MDYDRVILEMLNRISILEEKVRDLGNSSVGNAEVDDRLTKGTGKKYRYLADYLLISGKDQVTLTFQKMEEILRFTLPNSAYEYREFWANTTTHSIALSWLSVGYKTVEVSLGKYVVFEKERNY